MDKLKRLFAQLGAGFWFFLGFFLRIRPGFAPGCAQAGRIGAVLAGFGVPFPSAGIGEAFQVGFRAGDRRGWISGPGCW